MKHEIIQKLHKNFNDYAQKTENGLEFWFARDLQGLLGYDKWENFQKVIEKAKIACKTTGLVVEDHFPDVGKMINLPKGAKSGIIPENLPPAEDIKKVERRLKSEDKKFLKGNEQK